MQMVYIMIGQHQVQYLNLLMNVKVVYACSNWN